ncbi:DUF2835 domain-containing protein [Catenovulum sp. SM1970]|uniref:DUF2835 family protein n=1 Tax=Marinifaba aquimaris TaxID=2741323 RepID=UPI001571B535|nr:DUF2835 family protein [Marinifaba aquimaris]NTS76071.1 DUF2835 domain-containing protein [Marinifaba aquimaris]
MREFFFSLDISVMDCELLYTGQIQNVNAVAHNGLTVRLPAANLRPFVTQIGIKGVFRMLVDENNKIQSFIQVK